MEGRPHAGRVTTLSAYIDESFREAPSSGFYVLAAAIVESSNQDDLSDVALALRGNRKVAKLHWNEMAQPDQRKAASALAEVNGMHVVAVGCPVPVRRQERARAKCLTALILELRGLEVGNVIMEHRTHELDRRDRQTLAGLQRSLPKDAAFPRYGHQHGASERLLWIADLVAGVVRAEREGDPQYRQILDERIYEFEVRIDD